MLSAGTFVDVKSAGSGSEEASDVASEHRERLDSFDTMDDINKIAAGFDSSGRASSVTKFGSRAFSPRRQT